MNPFFFKSHALLHATISLLTASGQYGFGAALIVAAVYAVINVWSAWCFVGAARRSTHIRIAFGKAYLLALPATFVFLPVLATLLNDVVHHNFLIDDRYVFLFALGVAVLMLAGLYGVVLHHRGGQPIGSESGLTLALALLLATLLSGLVLLGLDAWMGFLPDVRLAE
jgi:hypothetical protein